MVATIDAASSRISPNARPSRPAPKNSGDHSMFSTSCTAYTPCAAGTHPALRHTSQPATAIVAYSTVHTGPNSHDGGAHDGWTRPAYCAGAEADARPRTTATMATATTKHASARRFAAGRRVV